MKKADFEMLSNEELQAMLNQSDSYSAEEITCAKEILRERNLPNQQKSATTKPHDEIPGFSQKPQNANWSRSDIQEIKGNIRTIKNCVVFFTVLAAISVCAGIISFIAMSS